MRSGSPSSPTWAGALGLPPVAVTAPLMHAANRRQVADVLTCIREGCTVDELGHRALPNAERRLRGPAELTRIYAGHPRALANAAAIADACTFSLDELRYQYPDEGQGEPPQERLARLAREGLRWRYPEGVPDRVQDLVERELQLIGKLNYAPYFLTVHDIVAFARERGILAQGRGSAANSVTCFALGITEISPDIISMVFERFVSEARNEPPDIDVDFEHERREEVIQHIYERYGRKRAGLCATVIHFRSRAAIREVGKAMGLSGDVTSALSGQIWGWSQEAITVQRLKEVGLDWTDRRLRQTIALVDQIIGFPRHLSQHVGGFVITEGRLDELCPIENAAMEDRTVIEWDKDDIDALGILKVDVLGLGMLTCLRKAFDLLSLHTGTRYTLATLPQEDPATYDMLCEADSLGVFQVESRAQMNFLPRMRPRCFYDLVIEVAIIRPGPIQGDMIHPYLRRRSGQEAVEFPSEELGEVLGKTLGVPLFQEQAMRIAIVAAGFTPDEADRLRRSLATFRKTGTISSFRERFIGGMLERGYAHDFAERCFNQIEGFGEYGFPESHAASFALLVYASAWLKRHHSRLFRLRAAELAAHGILRSRPDRPRRARAQGDGPAGLYQFQLLGLHAGARRAGQVRAQARLPAGQGPLRGRRPVDRRRPRQRLSGHREPVASREHLAAVDPAPRRGRCFRPFRHRGPGPPRRAVGGAGPDGREAPAPLRGRRGAGRARPRPAAAHLRRGGGQRLPRDEALAPRPSPRHPAAGAVAGPERPSHSATVYI